MNFKYNYQDNIINLLLILLIFKFAPKWNILRNINSFHYGNYSILQIEVLRNLQQLA
jgi:hypothetical protein